MEIPLPIITLAIAWYYPRFILGCLAIANDHLYFGLLLWAFAICNDDTKVVVKEMAK